MELIVLDYTFWLICTVFVWDNFFENKESLLSKLL